MIRFAANLTLLYPDLPALDRPARAAAEGFDGVEILFPYDRGTGDWAAVLDRPLALINTPPGDWAGGERGFAAVPGAEDRFRTGFDRALDYAYRLGAGRLHVMAGCATGPAAEETFLRNLDWAATQAGGLPLTIEPLNPGDMPGYFLNDFDQAARLLDRLGRPGVGLQFDLWHAQRITGDAAACWARHGARATHVQIAGLATRHAPDAAALAVIPAIAARFDGWISAEHHPAPADWLGRARALAGGVSALRPSSRPGPRPPSAAR